MTVARKKKSATVAAEPDFPELYRMERPKLLKDLIGQPDVVETLKPMLSMGTLPHMLLMTGPTGTGKTTTARIIAKKLNNGKENSKLVVELNCAGESRGIETIREIREASARRSWVAGTRVYILDEAHMLTRDAQSALLKMTEDPPPWVYYVLCSTDPTKLIDTLRTRSTHLVFKAGTEAEIATLVATVADKHGISLTKKTKDAIVESANGSYRTALVSLNAIRYLQGESKQIASIYKVADPVGGFQLAKMIYEATSIKDWDTIRPVLAKIIKTEEPERVRLIVLGYFKSVALNTPASRSGALGRLVFVIENFSQPYYSTGAAGLVASCVGALNT